MDTSENAPAAAMVAQHLCPVCAERATLRCVACERFFCAEHVARGFSLGYAFVCVECVATLQEAAGADGQAPIHSSS